MNIAIVAATPFELNNLKESIQSKHNIHYHVHGIGMLSSIYHLTLLINKNYDLIIQIGIAGTFTKKLEIGDVVFVQHEILGDFGAENYIDFLDAFELDFIQENEPPFTQKMLTNVYTNSFIDSLVHVKDLTVNTCAGKISTISKRILKFNADIETMEGASLHYVCLKNNIPFIQLRAISNFIEPRNRDNWNIPLAVSKLHEKTITLLNTLEQHDH